MVDERYIQLLRTLTTKTEDRRAIWEKGTRASEFSIRFKSGTLVIDRWFDRDEQKTAYDFQVYNGDGDMIYSSGPLDVSDPAFAPMVDLHEIVTRRYYKVDETVEGFIGEVSEEGTIGGEPPSSRSPSSGPSASPSSSADQ